MSRTGLEIPLLRTERLRLEPLSQAHSQDMYDLWRRPEVCEFSGKAFDFEGRPIILPARSPADSDQIIDFFVRSAAEGTRCRWAVISVSEDVFVGALGFNALNACSEFAYHFSPRFWRRGFAFEAARAALGWLVEDQSHRSIECFIESGNTASAALARRLGLKATGEIVDGAERFFKTIER